MFNKKEIMNVTSDEKELILYSLVELRNSLLRDGRYTDAVDELLLKLFSE